MKLFITTFLLTLFCGNIFATPEADAIDAVRSFGENLSKWSVTKETRLYREAIKDMASATCHVSDMIMIENRPNDVSSEIPQLTTYLSIIEKYVLDSLKISFSNISVENSPDFAAVSLNYAGSRILVKCDIKMEGLLNYDVTDLFYVRGGRITAISDYGNERKINNAIYLYNQGNYNEAYRLIRDLAYTFGPDLFSDIKDNRWAICDILVGMEVEGRGCKHLDSKVKAFDINLFIDAPHYNGIIFVVDEGSDRTPVKRSFNSLPQKISRDANGNLLFDGLPLNNRKRKYVNVEAFRNSFPYTMRFTGKNEDRNICLWKWFFQNCGYRKFFYAYDYKILPYRKGTKFGFINMEGDIVIVPKYQMAFPFDKKTGIAFVKSENGKWGFINKQGKEIGLFQYDMGCGEFVNGKTFVIKNNELCLIDTRGEILTKYTGYRYIHPIVAGEKEIIAESNHGWDCFDFDGNLTFKDCMPWARLISYEDRRKEYRESLNKNEKYEHFYKLYSDSFGHFQFQLYD